MDFAQYEDKYAARARMIFDYRQVTGNWSVPADKHYWTLCAVQSDSPRSELAQVLKSGLITIEQFHGIDKDSSVIRKNREKHPLANWHVGEWYTFVRRPCFKPGFVYLDTTITGHRAVPLVEETLRWSPKETILFVNVIVKTPYSGKLYDPEELLRGLMAINACSRWKNPTKTMIVYSSTKHTTMATFMLLAVR